MKVCEKVQAKQVTSYNEVADELVREFTAPHQASPISPSEQVTTMDWLIHTLIIGISQYWSIIDELIENFVAFIPSLSLLMLFKDLQTRLS